MDLELLQERALIEGLPYQILMSRTSSSCVVQIRGWQADR